MWGFFFSGYLLICALSSVWLCLFSVWGWSLLRSVEDRVYAIDLVFSFNCASNLNVWSSHCFSHLLYVLFLCFEFFHIFCSVCLYPVLYHQALFDIVFFLNSFYFKWFPLSFLVKLLGFLIPSSVQLDSSSLFLSLLNYVFKSCIVFIIYISLIFIFSWASHINLFSLSSFFLIPLNCLFKVLEFIDKVYYSLKF